MIGENWKKSTDFDIFEFDKFEITLTLSKTRLTSSRSNQELIVLKWRLTMELFEKLYRWTCRLSKWQNLNNDFHCWMGMISKSTYQVKETQYSDFFKTLSTSAISWTSRGKTSNKIKRHFLEWFVYRIESRNSTEIGAIIATKCLVFMASHHYGKVAFKVNRTILLSFVKYTDVRNVFYLFKGRYSNRSSSVLLSKVFLEFVGSGII